MGTQLTAGEQLCRKGPAGPPNNKLNTSPQHAPVVKKANHLVA